MSDRVASFFSQNPAQALMAAGNTLDDAAGLLSLAAVHEVDQAVTQPDIRDVVDAVTAVMHEFRLAAQELDPVALDGLVDPTPTDTARPGPRAFLVMVQELREVVSALTGYCDGSDRRAAIAELRAAAVEFHAAATQLEIASLPEPSAGRPPP